MSPRQRKLLPWLSLLIVWVVWGSTYLAIRVVVREMPPFAAASLRFFTAGLVMSVVALYADRRHGRPTPRQLLDYSLVGVLLLSIGNAFVMWAEKTIPSGIAALIVATVPLWLTLFDGWRRGGQAWTRRIWAGTLVGLLGVALVARPTGGVASGHWAGIVGLQVGALSWTMGLLYAQSVTRRLPLFTASAVEMLAGSVVLFLESRLFGEDLGAFTSASSVTWASLAYLAVFGSLVGFTAFAYCLNELPASTVGTYAYVNPVVAVVLGAVILGERLYPSLLAGALLILLAVLLSTTGRPGGRVREPERVAVSESAG
jgi:drug/metabolite transporter (DMT)-like permease